MQRIERYGVIALVFLLVTIVAVALWGQRDEHGLLAFMKKGEEKPDTTASAPGRNAQPIADEKQQLPLTPPTASRDLPTVWSRTEGVAERPPEAVLNERSARKALRLEQEQRDAATMGVANAPTIANNAPPSGVALAPQLPLHSATAAAPPARPTGGRRVTVKSGDTLGEIAQRELGTSKRWPEIVALNPGVDPKSLRVGAVLELPAGSVAAPPAANAAAPMKKTEAPGREASGATYVVKKGDTLGQIAQRELGSSARWKELVDLNPGLDPQRMAVGARLRMPAGAARPAQQERPLTVAAAPKAPPTARELSQTGRRGGRVR